MSERQWKRPAQRTPTRFAGRMAGASALAAHCPRDHDEKLLGEACYCFKVASSVGFLWNWPSF